MELVCAIQNYEWGCIGKESLVAKFAQANNNIDIEEGKPYAEFWMGTHKNGPSVLKDSNVPLEHHIASNPSELGNSETTSCGKELSFLFKILSVNKALSIQIHPSKLEAENLYKERPNIYKDSNHKPELAIALTEFKALCSFRPAAEIKFFLKNLPEFELVIEKQMIENLLHCNGSSEEKVYLKACFESLMLCKDNVINSAVENLVERLGQASVDDQQKFLYDLVMKLNREYPGDVGIFCIYWLNYVILKPGEALYIPPREPHAYLSGDCIECMANSDNVIRAGLTRKLKDVPTLCNLLAFNCCSPSSIIFKPQKENKFCILFSPPVKDFAVAQIIIPNGEEFTLPKRRSASLLLVFQGDGKTEQGKQLKPGTVYYIPSGEEFILISEEKIILYQAFSNI